MVDPVIDEHFRRSLGADYMNLFGNHLNQLKSSRSAANQTTSNNNNNNKINNKSPQISPIESKAATKPVIPISNKASTEYDESENGTGTGPATGTIENIEFSVDDHFAKALGDTWKQLQQIKQINSSPADSPSPNKMEIDDNTVAASDDENDDDDDDCGASDLNDESDKNNSDSPR